MEDLVVAPEQGLVRAARVVGGVAGASEHLAPQELPGWVAARVAKGARIVWADSAELYPGLLAAGVRVASGVDLCLQRRILRSAAAVAHTGYATQPASAWDQRPEPVAPDAAETLFPVLAASPLGFDAVLAEHLAQQACLAEAADEGRLALLCHAESTGALLAQELNHTGVPFDLVAHDRALAALLGARDPMGGRPARMAELTATIRAALQAPRLNPDSPPALAAALRRAGLDVENTSKWELRRLDHPVVEPLLEYKVLARLHTANGWAWAQEWVHEARFRPQWVAGGVVTGRWASSGGGALQLPRQVRPAVRADAGWRLVVADAAQLEPRVLAAMSRDEAMGRAASAGDLYQALVDAGSVEHRAHAKVAMLGAMYGATTGEAGALMPRLRRDYPRAIALVDRAAEAGERGEQVSTWLGRTSPAPSSRFRAAQEAALQPGAGNAEARRARQVARDQGRFTRNFVVQGTAAEWALCWLGHLRRSLDDAFGGLDQHPEIVYFLHDEVMVHAPAELADQVAEMVRVAARSAGRLLFGSFPVDFPVSVAVARSYDQAK